MCGNRKIIKFPVSWIRFVGKGAGLGENVGGGRGCDTEECDFFLY